jgi:1-acyl-sn-glycerol-3-phosphate acyltransferase
MQNIIIDKPYVPIPPYHGRLWPSILSRFAPRMLRKKYGVTKVDCVNTQRLVDSIRAGHGILLAPNHCRDEDPIVLQILSRAAGEPFFIMASWHVFMQRKTRGYLTQRSGAFSIYREGIDRAAIDSAVEILETAERPLVIFPEGLIARTNDHLNPLMDGAALIGRSAAKKRAKLEPPKKVVVHPIAIRYHFEGDINAAATEVLNEIESRLTWTPLKGMPLLDRIYKVGGALISLKELEYIGHPQTGEIHERLSKLIDAILSPMEDEWVASRHDGNCTARVKRLRSAILPDVVKGEIDEPERQRRWKHLADCYLAQQLWHYPPDYVKSNPTPDRILETIERFEEDLTDKIRLHSPITATVTVGEPIEVQTSRESRGGPDPLLQQIEQQLTEMLHLTPITPTTPTAGLTASAVS